MIAQSVSLYAVILIFFSGTALSLLYLHREKGRRGMGRSFIMIFSITLLQLMLLSLLYGIELKSVGYEASLSSTLSYTGSSNLALFVAFTPGAVGIREWFILTAQNIHEIPTDIVLSASLYDRAVYILFLGVLFMISSVFHIKKRLLKTKAWFLRSITPWCYIIRIIIKG